MLTVIETVEKHPHQNWHELLILYLFFSNHRLLSHCRHQVRCGCCLVGEYLQSVTSVTAFGLVVGKGNVIRMVPPLIVLVEELEEVYDILERCLLALDVEAIHNATVNRRLVCTKASYSVELLHIISLVQVAKRRRMSLDKILFEKKLKTDNLARVDKLISETLRVLQQEERSYKHSD